MFSHRRGRVGVVLLAMVTAGLATGVVVDTRPGAVRAQEWAANSVGRFRNGPELAEHQLAFRRAAFVLMSPAAKSKVAQSYLEGYSSKSALTAQQRIFLMETRGLLTPATYADGTAWKTDERLLDACSRMQHLFPDKTERDLLTTFGARPDPSRDWRGHIGQLKGFFGLSTAHASAAEHLCDCARFSFCTGCSGTGGHCLSGCECRAVAAVSSCGRATASTVGSGVASGSVS
jgi:hypothetical protein